MKKLFWVLLVLGVAVGVAGSVYGYRTYAGKDHTHTRDEAYRVLADGAYDNDYGLLNYTRRDVNELTTSTRPVSVFFFDKDGQVLGGHESRGTGILCGKYVVTRASLLNSVYAGITDKTLVASTKIFLLSQNLTQNKVDVEELIGFYINLERDLMVLERRGNAEGTFIVPTPEGCGFPVGNVESAGNVLYQVGRFGSTAIDVDSASVNLVLRENSTFIFQGSFSIGDSGGPIFALRDGHFELVGMNLGFFPNTTSKGLGLDFSFIVEQVKKVTGLDLLTGMLEETQTE